MAANYLGMPVMFAMSVCKRSVASASKAGLRIVAIIKNLTKHLPADQSHHLFMDKWYMNHAVMESILDDGHDFTGVGKRNNFKSLFEKHLGAAKDNTTGLSHSNREYTTQAGNSAVISAIGVKFIRKTKGAVRPKENVQAFFSSTLSGDFVEENVQESEERTAEPINLPESKKVDMVVDYKENHRFVDTVDQIIRGVEFPHRLYRFTMPVFIFCMQAMAMNAWSIYVQLGNKKESFPKALESLAKELIPNGKASGKPQLPIVIKKQTASNIHKVMKIPTPNVELGKDLTPKRKRQRQLCCSYCKSGKTSYMCDTCEPRVYLHVNGNGCFKNHHSEQKLLFSTKLSPNNT